MSFPAKHLHLNIVRAALTSLDNLYTRAMLEGAFLDFLDLLILEEEREIKEGKSYCGISALISLTARKASAP